MPWVLCPSKMVVFLKHFPRKKKWRMIPVDSKYYTTEELAGVLNFAVSWVEKWRPVIVGAQRVGRTWRFDKAVIDGRIAKGQDVREVQNLLVPGGRKYIKRVHGAKRSKMKGDTHGTN